MKVKKGCNKKNFQDIRRLSQKFGAEAKESKLWLGRKAHLSLTMRSYL